MQLIYEIFNFIMQVLWSKMCSFIDLFYFPKHGTRNNLLGSFLVMAND